MKRVDVFEPYKGKDGDWWWRLRSPNGKIRADSGEGYRRESTCLKAIEKCRLAVVTAIIKGIPRG